MTVLEVKVAQSCRTLGTIRTVAHQAPLSVRFLRQNYWCWCWCWCWWFSLKGMSDSCDPMDHSPPGSCVLGIFPGKNTGVGCHFLLQGIFPTQGSNLSLLHGKQILYWLSHQGSTKNTGVDAVPFSRGSSWPQASNHGLQHCWQILYPLSYQWTLHSKMALKINWIQRGKWLVIPELCQKTGLWNVGQELLCGWKWLG